MKCKKCGHELTATDKFCMQCGTPVAESTQPEGKDSLVVPTPPKVKNNDLKLVVPPPIRKKTTIPVAPAVKPITTIPCVKCGYAMKPTDSFCPSCGHVKGAPVVSGESETSSTNNKLILGVIGCVIAVLVFIVAIFAFKGNSSEHKVHTSSTTQSSSSSSERVTSDTNDTTNEPASKKAKAISSIPAPTAPSQSEQEDATRAAGRRVVEYHQDLTDREYYAAYDILTESRKQHMGPVSAWSPGYRTTVESRIVALRPISQSLTRVVFRFKLKAVDRTDSGGLNTRYFVGDVTMVKRGGVWFMDDMTAQPE